MRILNVVDDVVPAVITYIMEVPYTILEPPTDWPAVAESAFAVLSWNSAITETPGELWAN